MDTSVLNMDISLTTHRGEVLADRAEEAEIGFTRDTAAGHTSTNDVCSFIANITAYCLNNCMSFAVFFDSEPGDGDRNETIGGTFHYFIEGIGLNLDAEYMAAVSRENASNDEEAKESAGFLAVAYQVTEPLQLAARYEFFDDDISGNQAGSLEDRFSLGATYRLFEKGTFVCNLIAEYRRSNYENAPGADDKLNEFFGRLAIEF
jgi:predicted porin